VFSSCNEEELYRSKLVLKETSLLSLFIHNCCSYSRHQYPGAILGSWTVGALIEMVFIAALSGIGLWILQVPLALAHAVLAGLLNFIPNIGPTLSVVFPMAIAKRALLPNQALLWGSLFWKNRLGNIRAIALLDEP
jgi:hypothetical protein